MRIGTVVEGVDFRVNGREEVGWMEVISPCSIMMLWFLSGGDEAGPAMMREAWMMVFLDSDALGRAWWSVAVISHSLYSRLRRKDAVAGAIEINADA